MGQIKTSTYTSIKCFLKVVSVISGHSYHPMFTREFSPSVWFGFVFWLFGQPRNFCIVGNITEGIYAYFLVFLFKRVRVTKKVTWLQMITTYLRFRISFQTSGGGPEKNGSSGGFHEVETAVRRRLISLKTSPVPFIPLSQILYHL